MKVIIFLFLVFPILVFSQDESINLSLKLKKHVSFLADDSQQGRGLGTNGIERARSYIKQEFKSAGLKPFYSSYMMPFQFRENLSLVQGVNLVGYVEGTDPKLKDEYIVIGAHYDHLGYKVHQENDTIIYNGADDNASGTAGLIELAHYFSNPDNKIKRSIIFIAFDAEESGLIGSTKFVENPPVPLQNIKTMFSLDMIGMLSKNNGLDLKGLDFLDKGHEIFQEAVEGKGIKLRNTKKEIERQTDTAPFGDVGIPSVHVFTGLESPYHEPNDTYDLLDYEGMAKIVEILSQSIKSLANENEITLAKRVNEKMIQQGGKKSLFTLGVVVNIGSGNHRYVDQFYRSKRTLNGSLGLTSNIRLTKNIGLISDIVWDFNGGAGEHGVIRRASTTIPISIQFATDDTKGNYMRAFFNFGGFYRMNNFAWNDKVPMDFDEHFTSSEYGVNTEFGIKIGRFEIRYTYRRGLSENRIMNERFQDVNHLLGLVYNFW